MTLDENTRAWLDSHPQPEPVETVPDVIAAHHTFSDGTTVIRIGERDDEWQPERPSAQPCVPPTPVSELRHGAVVERSEERDTAGNPKLTVVRL